MIICAMQSSAVMAHLVGLIISLERNREESTSIMPEVVLEIIHTGKICLIITAGAVTGIVFCTLYIPIVCVKTLYLYIKKRFEWPSTKRKRLQRAEEDRLRAMEEQQRLVENARRVAGRQWPRALGKRERALSIGREGVMGVWEAVDGRQIAQSLKIKKAKKAQIAEVAKRKTDAQEKSRLFDLPFETRQKIWKELTGGYVIHIKYVDGYRRIQHQRCKSRCGRCECRRQSKQKGALDPWGQCDLLAPLRSCRRM